MDGKKASEKPANGRIRAKRNILEPKKLAETLQRVLWRMRCYHDIVSGLGRGGAFASEYEEDSNRLRVLTKLLKHHNPRTKSAEKE